MDAAAEVPFPELSRAELTAIVARHGLDVDVAAIERLPSTGVGRFGELFAFATEQPEEWARWVACAGAVG